MMLASCRKVVQVSSSFTELECEPFYRKQKVTIKHAGVLNEDSDPVSSTVYCQQVMYIHSKLYTLYIT